ncbi:MAG: NAD(P)-dependent oxidoreductase [Methanobacterium sp.]|uniref:NAD-dependent epimerase/dehydratase family protein n=1 Tax=Methanobacterium sp. TaxID=2164 RepID=UPI003D65F96F|nr:NAD(P)-dependent oxidoreductase [Methanobacterium sp.]
MNKTVLVTGGTGFIGSHVIERLLEDKFDVILLKRSYSDVWRVKNILEYIQSYNIDEIKLEDIFKKEDIDSIFHIAAYYKKFHSSNDLDSLISSNITFPVKLLELSNEYNVNHFINTGTFFEYSNKPLPVTEENTKTPFNLYAMTKIVFESILKTYATKKEIKATTLNLFSTYGPKDNEYKLFPQLIKAALKEEEIKLSQGFQKLDFVYVKDIASAYMQCMNNMDSLPNYDAINIGNGFPYSIREIVSVIEEILGKPIGKIWGNPAEEEIDITFASKDKSSSILKWAPKYSLHNGLNETITYYRDEYDL